MSDIYKYFRNISGYSTGSESISDLERYHPPKGECRNCNTTSTVTNEKRIKFENVSGFTPEFVDVLNYLEMDVIGYDTQGNAIKAKQSDLNIPGFGADYMLLSYTVNAEVDDNGLINYKEIIEWQKAKQNQLFINLLKAQNKSLDEDSMPIAENFPSLLKEQKLSFDRITEGDKEYFVLKKNILNDDSLRNQLKLESDGHREYTRWFWRQNLEA